MKFLVPILVFFFLSSCSNIKNVGDNKGAYDYYQLEKAGDNTSRPIRNKDGQLLFKETNAQLELSQIESFSVLSDRVDNKCRRNFKLSTHYHQAVSFLKDGNIDLARGELEKVRTLCTSIELIYHFYFIEAYLAQLDGDNPKRNEMLELFLAKSESIYPLSFFQEDFVKPEKIELYELYKEHARGG
jgi:hypothetical protein